jgi:hypothetical protein
MALVIQDETAKHMSLMVQDEITYVRKKLSRFEGNYVGRG